MSTEEPNKNVILARDLINRESTMTLATANENAAWAAPVYYVFQQSAFYFFSGPNSRHIKESKESGQASGAISASVSTWREIRGIQMSGQVQEVTSGLAALHPIASYLKKYPFVKEFLAFDQSFDLEAFSKRFKVGFYRFTPDLVYYLDNGIEFGFREEITL